MQEHTNLGYLMTGRQRLAAFLGVLLATAVLLALWTRGVLAGTLLGATLTVFLWITRALWLPPGHGRTRLRLASLGVVLSVALTLAGWGPSIEALVAELLLRFFSYNPSWLSNLIRPDGRITALILLFVLSSVFLINYFARDATAMKIHPTHISKEIPERSFPEKLRAVCESLTEDLKTEDFKTRWSTKYFTPLDAEVELTTPKGIKRKTSNLLRAIRGSSARVFLVLGDPGSGKSVALRKLCQDLAQEVHRTGKIPIYINLKNWQPGREWTVDKPPTQDELLAFVLDNLKGRDIVSSRFFNQYFDQLYESGRLFFVFDSFDEIPAVLGERENSELIVALSTLLFKFLKGARSDRSQGLLASRFFRRPTREFQAELTLQILPFTEAKILQTLERYEEFSRELTKHLFKYRPELVPVARNPFTANLLAEYVATSSGRLPSSQSQMYMAYIENTMLSADARIEKHDLKREDVERAARKIAREMFGAGSFEISISDLYLRIHDEPLDAVVDILKFSHLGRGVAGDETRFSFVHRRFAEFLAIQDLLDHSEHIDLEAIPRDSQWRDALVLYCEVAPQHEAERVATFCWDVIKKLKDPQDLRVIHSMRFLRDAFKGRLDCISSFRGALAQYIFEQIKPHNSALSVKLAVETVGLIVDKEIDRCIVQAMSLRNNWVTESAIRSCRNLAQISEDLQLGLVEFLRRLPPHKLLSDRMTLTFSFGLSEAFKSVEFYLKARILYTCIFPFGAVALAVFLPATTGIAVFLFSIGIFCYVLGLWFAGLNFGGFAFGWIIHLFRIAYPLLLLFVIGILLYSTSWPVRPRAELYTILSDEVNPLSQLHQLPSDGTPNLTGAAILFLYLTQIPLHHFLLNPVRGKVLRSSGSILSSMFSSMKYLQLRRLTSFFVPVLSCVILGFYLPKFFNRPFYLLAFVNIQVLTVMASLMLPLRQKRGIPTTRIKQLYKPMALVLVTLDLTLVVIIAFGAVVVTFVAMVLHAFLSILPGWLAARWWLLPIFLVVVLGARKTWSFQFSLMRERRSIVFSRLEDRSYFYHTFTKLRHSANREKVLLYLENNVLEAKGEWPSTELLRVSQGDVGARLSRLEERWLEIER